MLNLRESESLLVTYCQNVVDGHRCNKLIGHRSDRPGPRRRYCVECFTERRRKTWRKSSQRHRDEVRNKEENYV